MPVTGWLMAPPAAAGLDLLPRSRVVRSADRHAIRGEPREIGGGGTDL
jgi:hypothetical protein